MKIETLKERIKKTKENIVKSTATLERHKAQLVKKSKIVTDKGVNLSNYDKYDRTKIDHDAYWDLCDYESKLEDITNTEKKIFDYNRTLSKLQEQLDNQLAKDKENESMVPEVLSIFLENWKQKCTKFYIKLATDFLALSNKPAESYEVTKEVLESLTDKAWVNHRREIVKMYTDEEIADILAGKITKSDLYYLHHTIKQQTVQRFISAHFASDMVMVAKITEQRVIDKDKLNKLLDEDVKLKRDMFLARIKEVIGDIKDLKGLRISPRGEINGIAKGVRCNAKVETITAGGYNIQCFHFRLLVNTVK